ncbi:hypothetical protein [Amycolatopsis anabasis]|uniref:hypothetical protein n=1 Tax=Amycolatopsis anabasis TaxID=1840409 RepID=UPI00131CC298|nr:hypothetical protein [Amycolatopsis anabasis]
MGLFGGAAVAASAVLVGPAAGTAAAEPELVECVGSLSATFQPGLSLTPREVATSRSQHYGPCLPGGNISSGISESASVGEASCLTPSSAESNRKTIRWNTGEVSTFSYDRMVSNVGGTAVMTLRGTIVDGPFQGATAIEVQTVPTLNTLDCLSAEGVTSKSGVVTLTIAGL